MAQRSSVPQFGKWDAADDVPYTVYFDRARQGRAGGKITNPNDPQQNPDLFPNHAPPAPVAPSRARPGSEAAARGPVRQPHEGGRSNEENELRQYANSPARNDNVNRRAGGRGEVQRRPGRASVGSENSFERSPLHPHARVSGRGTGGQSPAWDSRGHDSSHGTPGRTKLRPRGDESPDKGAAVPKFGDWDESNPASADGYTHIFNKVREERNQVGTGRTPSRPSDPSHSSGYRQTTSNGSKGCCFPWCR